MEERRVALFDVDNTIYQGYVIFDLAKLQTDTGLVPPTCFESLLKDTKDYSKGKILYRTYARRAMVHWADGLRDKPYSEIYNQTLNFLRSENKLFPYFDKVVELLRSAYDIYLVTAEPQFVTGAIEDIFGLPKGACSIFESKDDKLTGNVVEVLSTRRQKISAIRKLLRRGHTLENSFGFGDSDSDIEMMEFTSFPIGFRKEKRDEKFEEQCLLRDWNLIGYEEGEAVVRELLRLLS